MDYYANSKRLEYLLEMIKKNRCMSIRQIASQFSCSNRTVKRMLALLRENGNEIEYCRKQKKFFIKIERGDIL